MVLPQGLGKLKGEPQLDAQCQYRLSHQHPILLADLFNITGPLY